MNGSISQAAYSGLGHCTVCGDDNGHTDYALTTWFTQKICYAVKR